MAVHLSIVGIRVTLIWVSYKVDHVYLLAGLFTFKMFLIPINNILDLSHYLPIDLRPPDASQETSNLVQLPVILVGIINETGA